MPSPLFEFAVLCFVSLFTMVNPIGVVPVFTSMTAHLPAAQARRVALKAVITALLILVFFAATGQFIFQFFSISIDSLRVVGGIIFFVMGYEMLQARLTRTQYDLDNPTEYASDIAITPLAIPVICGPGAITTVILLMNQSATWEQRGVLFGAMLAIFGLTHLLMLSGQGLVKLLGPSGNKVLLRLMGLIVMVIAVEFFFAGLKPILQQMGL